MNCVLWYNLKTSIDVTGLITPRVGWGQKSIMGTRNLHFGRSQVRKRGNIGLVSVFRKNILEGICNP